MCEPLFKLLQKNEPMRWNDHYQMAFDRIKTYLLNPPILVSSVLSRPLIMYLAVHKTSMGCVLGQHKETGKKEQAIYYLSKKLADCESRYSSIENSCCALV